MTWPQRPQHSRGMAQRLRPAETRSRRSVRTTLAPVAILGLIATGITAPATTAATCPAGMTVVSGLDNVCQQTFTTNGSFTVPSNSNLMQVLRVAGGGGGGGGGTGTGGGGGGGGEVQITGTFVPTVGSVYTLTIGAGGTGGGLSADGQPGGNTTVSGLSDALGGNGGKTGVDSGTTKGGDGGASRVEPSNHQGVGASGANGGGGGGGGASSDSGGSLNGSGANGGAGSASTLWNIGLFPSASQSPEGYGGGGGGGGGTAGTGGNGAFSNLVGGKGGNGGSAGSIAAETRGGGGGGGGAGQAGGTGGSGVVVIRVRFNVPAPPAPDPAPPAPEPEPTPMPTPTPAPTPTPTTPVNEPVTADKNPALADALAQSGSLLLVDGQQQNMTLSRTSGSTSSALTVRGDGFSLDLGSVGANRSQVGIPPLGDILFQQGGDVSVLGQGFAPGTGVYVWLFSEPRLLGTVETNSAGAFAGELPIPQNMPTGRHTLQINGQAPGGAVRSLSLAVRVETPPAPRMRTAKATVLFSASSSTLDARAKKTLRALVQGRATAIERTVSVGYAHRNNWSTANRALAQRRANAVARYMKSLGVKGVIVTRAEGSSPNSGNAGRKARISITYRE